MKNKLTALILLALAAAMATASNPESTSTRASVEALMRNHLPEHQFDTATVKDEASFKIWQEGLASAMARIMKHPQAQVAEPRKVLSRKRDGYTIERWESYPLEGSTVAFYVLIPLNVETPAPAALCIPGFGQTKELLAGEKDKNFMLEGDRDPELRRAAMARILAEKGMVAVAVDNPSCGELSDNGRADYVASSRFLLEVGWSYLGLASWQDKVILEWMKKQPAIDPDRIIVSGFSLGTEPMMVLGVMDPTIHAFIYNDFLCRTRERALVMNAPDAKGNRPYPNDIEHLIPEFLTNFDFPDIVAALAPRPVICTEGGLDRDFNIIAKAYGIANAPDAFTWHHYAKYADPAMRQQTDTLPTGIDRDTFFRLVNVDPPNHYFKAEHVLPWLKGLQLIKE
ncbi:MAG: alpha/beta hydrolase family protein [Bacteroides sp.]|nr:alpha/beta hydrolase family protein [Bacteroides sp.]